METLEFFQLLGNLCKGVPDSENCPVCPMQRFCYTAPASRTDEMVREAEECLRKYDGKRQGGTRNVQFADCGVRRT